MSVYCLRWAQLHVYITVVAIFRIVSRNVGLHCICCKTLPCTLYYEVWSESKLVFRLVESLFRFVSSCTEFVASTSQIVSSWIGPICLVADEFVSSTTEFVSSWLDSSTPGIHCIDLSCFGSWRLGSSTTMEELWGIFIQRYKPNRSYIPYSQ